MSAVIVALDTPYYAILDAAGRVAIADVPAGRYTLHVWREGTSTAALKKSDRLDRRIGYVRFVRHVGGSQQCSPFL